MANSASAKRAGRFFVAGLHTCAFSDLLAAVFFPRVFSGCDGHRRLACGRRRLC